jgi:hypothetical protein
MVKEIDLEQMAAMPRHASTFIEARTLADAFKGKPLENRDSGIVAIVSRNNLDKMLSQSAVVKSSSATEHALAVANLDHLFQNATYAWRKQDRDNNESIAGIHRLCAAMNTPEGMRLVKLTVKEFSRRSQENKIYSVEAIKIEKESSASIWVEANLKRDGLSRGQTPYAELVWSLADAVRKYNGVHAQTRTPREYLVVPFAEKDAAKAAGAVWDKKAKAWYIGKNAERDRLQA